SGESLTPASTPVLTRAMGMAPYRTLVALNGGNMSGRAVLSNFILMQPQTELGGHVDLLQTPRAALANTPCPLSLLAGARDHITPPAQLFAAADAVGTEPGEIMQRTSAG